MSLSLIQLRVGLSRAWAFGDESGVPRCAAERAGRGFSNTRLVLIADVPIAAFAPLLLIGVAFVVYCLVDLTRTPSVRYLPKWAWAVICLASIPIGGIVYLLVGRTDRE